MKTSSFLSAALVVTTLAFHAGRAAEPVAGTAARRPTFAELFGDDLVARGKGVEVRRSQLESAYVAYRANLASRGQAIQEDQRLMREAQLLERLVITQLLAQRATAEDKKVAADLSVRFMADAKKGVTSEEAFNRQLKAMGLSPEQFERRVNEQSLAEAVIAREVKSGIQVTEADVRAFYDSGTDLIVHTLQTELEALVKDVKSSPADVARHKERIDAIKKENLARMEQPERVRIQHVFFAGRDRRSEQELAPEQRKLKRQQAESVRQRAMAGEDFAKLITEFSEDRAIKDTKGEYVFSRTDPFSEEFKAASFSLEPGAISDVVSTSFGFHVIKLLERIPVKKAPFEEASKELKDFLVQQRLQQAMPEYFTKLRDDAAVEILDPKYRIEVPKLVDPTKLE
jgi:parvulin-like peptidyl-prolyl isomerase